MIRIYDYEMGDGDMIELEKASGRIAALENIARRYPWRAKACRALAHREAEILRNISARYGSH